MLPVITFRNSWIYDQMLLPIMHRKHKPVGDRKYKSIIADLEKEWKKVERKILTELARVTKLKWYEKEIVVYLTTGVYPFSDPLTLNLFGDTQHRINVLTHELIHRILSDKRNWPKYDHNWKRITNRYKNEPNITRYHIVIHAVHEHILRKFYDNKRLEKEMVSVRKKAYLRSWEIVKKVGYKNIITELTKGI